MTTVQPAERVIIGRVATLAGDQGFGWAEGIAIGVRGGVVTAGAASEIDAFIGPKTRVWRLPAHLAVMPGITDAHLHLTTAALAATQLDLSGVTGLDAALAAVCAADRELAAVGDSDSWLLGHGWSMDRLGGWPTATDLETAAPGRRIALWAHDHHARWVSEAALRAAAIGRASADPPGGAIRRGGAGEPTGILHENAATLVDQAVPEASAAEIEQAVIAYAHRLAALGVTGAHDPGQLLDDPDAVAGPWLYSDMSSRSMLPMRVVASIREGQLKRAVGLGFRSGLAHGRYRSGWLKLFSDGSLGSRSAALLEPYEADDPGGPPVGGPRGMPLRTTEELAASAAAAGAAGVATQIHAIGDAAVRVALDVLAGLPRPAERVHHRIEHAQLIHPDDIPRFAKLGVAASVQPCHLCSDALAEVSAWGARSANTFPLRSLAASGAVIPFGTDAPVESPDPWRNLAAAVARRDASWSPDRGAFHPEESLPLWRALRAACVDPPLSAGERYEGRLNEACRADLLIVPAAGLVAHDAQVFAAARPADESGSLLAATRPLATLINGKVVYRSPDFDLGD